MYAEQLKTGASWAGLGIAAVLLGTSLYGIVLQALPSLLQPFLASGEVQLEMLNTVWRCLG